MCTYNSMFDWLFPFIYRRCRLPIWATPPEDTGDSARIQDETTENSAWFFNVLGVQHRHTGPRFNVSSERQLIILVGQPGTRTHTCRDPKHYVHESYAQPTELIGRLQ